MEDDKMRLPIARPTPLECLLWAGAGLLWAFAGGVPVASLLGPARHDADFVLVGDGSICRAGDPNANTGHAPSAGALQPEKLCRRLNKGEVPCG
jgi:hypothetical protein